MVKDVDIWLERISSLRSSLLRRAASAEGLQFIHAEILEYLSRCNRYSNTATALKDYLGLTKGSLSQSLRLLEQKGLVAKMPCPDDKRSSRLSLTVDGEAILKRLGAHIPALEDGGNQHATALAELLKHLQREHGLKGFGLCKRCKYNETLKEGRFRCGLTGEALTVDDISKICREFSF